MKTVIKLSLGDSQKLFNSLREKSGTFFFTLGRHAFLVILILVLISVSLGALLLYKYIFLVNNAQLEVSSGVTRFQENMYDSVLKERETRKAIFDNSPGRDYSDPFN